MSKFIINGPAKLSGEIAIGGAKNAALKIIPASILSTDEIKITNLPKIEDIDKSLELLNDLGALIKRGKKTATVNTSNLKKTELKAGLAKKFRASIMFVGPLLARFGEAAFPHPGGCVIGAGGRPIDLFLDGFKALGAEIYEGERSYRLKAGRLIGANIFFPKISVTATESLMMTAVLAKGTTILQNCAMEPEIPALAEYLNRNGAKITGAGTTTIKIIGVKKITAGVYKIIPDRIETGSFAIMAAVARSRILIKNCDPKHIRILLEIFNKIRVPFKLGADFIQILPVKDIKPYSIKTHEYPGFPTDLQQPYTVLMTQASGTSLIHDTIYDRRLMYVDMLMQMGANIILCDPHRIAVNGPARLFGKSLTSPDLRAGIAMVIAGLAAEGRTEIDNIYQIDRGYEDIDGRLRALGADIRRV